MVNSTGDLTSPSTKPPKTKTTPFHSLTGFWWLGIPSGDDFNFQQSRKRWHHGKQRKGGARKQTNYSGPGCVVKRVPDVSSHTAESTDTSSRRLTPWGTQPQQPRIIRGALIGQYRHRFIWESSTLPYPNNPCNIPYASSFTCSQKRRGQFTLVQSSKTSKFCYPFCCFCEFACRAKLPHPTPIS